MKNIKILSFIKVEMGKTQEVIDALKKIPVVKEINFITGEYDLTILMEGSDNELNDSYLNALGQVKGIATSNSHLVIKQFLVNQIKPLDCFDATKN
jgi:hypothetical protein